MGTAAAGASPTAAAKAVHGGRSTAGRCVVHNHKRNEFCSNFNIRVHNLRRRYFHESDSSKQQHQLQATCVLNDQQCCMRCYCCMMCKDIAARTN
eukprot:1159-Heterococcus_DN1.PRE.2